MTLTNPGGDPHRRDHGFELRRVRDVDYVDVFANAGPGSGAVT